MKSVASLSLFIILPCVLAADYNSYYQNDNYGGNYDNGDYNNNNNNDYYNGGGDNYGNDNNGKIQTIGKFVANGNADKGLSYNQVTYFHKGSKYKKKFANYDTKGKVHSYGKQNIKAKFHVESKLHSKGKYNGGKFDNLVGGGGDIGGNNYAEGQIPIDNAAYGSGPSNTPSNNDNYITMTITIIMTTTIIRTIIITMTIMVKVQEEAVNIQVIMDIPKDHLTMITIIIIIITTIINDYSKGQGYKSSSFLFVY
uniref:Stress protein DDR48 (DNA damage-responsive protein 48) n=1 Tax=Schistosoma japonicum TaxID=6182 RepID=C1LC48_SCHJA|nr:Stress protein DDR48 (DNA damage-responsive protein 48) [Schistosoma japonicum]